MSVDDRGCSSYVSSMSRRSITAEPRRGAFDELPPQTPFSEFFDEFVDHQFRDVVVREIVSSTAGIVVVCAFLMGACERLAKQQRVNRNKGNRAVVRALMERLAMTEFNAEGLISANQRLSEKYQLIANMQQRGEQAADAWLDDRQALPVMPELVEKGQLLTLSDLNSEGIREVEATLAQRARDVGRSVADSWIGKLLFWLMILALVAALNLWFFGHSELLRQIEQELSFLIDK